MTTTPAIPSTRDVRVQDLTVGMKIPRLNGDLRFVYVEVTQIEPIRLKGRTKSYRISFGIPADGTLPAANAALDHSDIALTTILCPTSGAASILQVVVEND